MLKNFYRRFKGVDIIHHYDENGKKVIEFAEVKWEPLFSWPMFVAVMLIGLMILGHSA